MTKYLKQLSKLRLYHLWLPSSLVWLIAPVNRGTGTQWIDFWLAWIFFLFLYVKAHSSRSVTRWVSVSLLFVLGVIYIPENPEAAGIFSFCAAAIAARSTKPLLVYGFMAISTLVLFVESLAFHLNHWTWIGGGGGGILFATYVLFDSRERESNIKLQIAQEELAHLAKLAERERITRDLHDVLGHTLSLIALKSQVVQKIFVTDPLKSLTEAEEIEVIARRALNRVRETIHGYRSVRFRNELDEMTSSLRQAGIKVAVRSELVSLTLIEESVLAMVLQEATTNVIRHSQATECTVEVFVNGNRVHLVVRDNGQRALRMEGYGIRGMRARLELVNGRLDISFDSGTQLDASLECKSAVPEVAEDDTTGSAQLPELSM